MKIKYFYDPLCGWCYGASHALEKAEALGFEIESYPVGLFAGKNGRSMSPEWAAHAWENDQRIQKITGQIFSQDYRNNVLSNFSVPFDSWLPTAAVILHASRFKDEALKMLRAIQKARFVEGLDNTSSKVLANIANRLGWDSDEFSKLLLDQNCREEARRKIIQNLATFEGYHANGVPLIVIAENGQERILHSSFVFTENPNPMAWSQN